MRALTIKLFVVLSCWCTYAVGPVWAHVKWFLNRPESELLKQPKPALFTQLSIYNAIPVVLALVSFYFIYIMNSRFSNWYPKKQLLVWARRYESIINLLMAIGFSSSLIYCG